MQSSFFFPFFSFLFIRMFIYKKNTEEKKKRSNYFFFSFPPIFHLLLIRSIDFTSLIYGCAPSKVLFSYLLIHQEFNQMCHFVNACPMSPTLFFFFFVIIIINIHIYKKDKKIYCAKHSYRILTVN